MAVTRSLLSPALERACSFLVDLVNSDPQRAKANAEGLGDPDAVRALLLEHHFEDVPDRIEHGDVLEIQSMRERLCAACDADDIAGTAEILNDLLVRVHAVPSLCQHDSIPWHVHYTTPAMSLAQRIAAYAGMGLVSLVAAGQRDRLAVCAAPDCSRLFLDVSRNRSRIYCDSRLCGNRLHASAYRRRQLAR